MTIRQRRWSWIAVVVLVGVGTVAIPSVRVELLSEAGWILVSDDSVEPAGSIVVAVEAGGAGVLEAADLVDSGIATRVDVGCRQASAVVEPRVSRWRHVD